MCSEHWSPKSIKGRPGWRVVHSSVTGSIILQKGSALTNPVSVHVENRVQDRRVTLVARRRANLTSDPPSSSNLTLRTKTLMKMEPLAA